MVAAVDASQQQALTSASTLQHQQQHFAFLRSDAAQLQQKVIQEVAKFEEHTIMLKDFLLNFIDEFADPQQHPHGEYKYRNYLQEIADQKRYDLPVHLQDVASYFAGHGGGDDGSKAKGGRGTLGAYEALLVNTPRYVELLYAAADMLLSQTDLFPAAAETERMQNDIEQVLGGGDLNSQDDMAEATARARRMDPWRRIRARDMAARGVPAHLRHSL
ncbi:hypothetical protein ACSSS7_007026 [Eimeria intestinalis]